MAKQNQKSSKFLTGALVGAMLGIAVGVLAETKTGKKLAKQAKGKSGEFYKYIIPKLKKAKQMGEKEYKLFIKSALETYAKNKELTKEEVDSLAKQTHKYWKLLKKHL